MKRDCEPGVVPPSVHPRKERTGGAGGVPSTTCATVDTQERKVVDLTGWGFPEIPVLGRSAAARASGAVPFHRHAGCMEITLCTRGSVKFDCEGRSRSLLQGHVFATRPRDIHRMRANNRGAHLYWLFLRLPEKGETLLGLPERESNALAKRLMTFPDRMFAAPDDASALFERLFPLCAGKRLDAIGTLAVRSTLISLLAALADAGHAAAPESPDAAVLAVMDRMRRRPERSYPVADLAREMGLSPNTVSARFRRMTGLPPHAFLVKCRIRRAMKLLRRSPSAGMADIALSLGFASSQHFATSFKQETGTSPSEWRDGAGFV